MNRKELLMKGWTENEINQTLKILESEESKSENLKKIQNFIYWASIFVVMIGSITASALLVPYTLVLTPTGFYFMAGFFAFLFGLVFTIIIRNLIQLNKKDYIVSSLFLPFVAIISVFIILFLSDYLYYIQKPVSGLYINPMFTGFIYAFAYMLPYLAFNVYIYAVKHFSKKNRI